MEQIINIDNVSSILKDTNLNSDSFLKLIRSLYYYCVKIEINKDKIDIDIISKKIESLRVMEKISLFVFSHYINHQFNYKNSRLGNVAMELSAIAFEKLGNYVEYIETEEINIVGVKHKQLKYYLRSSIAYQLAGNSPSSIYISNKYKKSLDELLIHDNDINSELIELYKLGYCVLSRNFTSYYRIEFEYLRKALNDLTLFVNSGDERCFKNVIDNVDNRISYFLTNFITQELWVLKFIKLCICKIRDNSVWTNLGGKYSVKYIKQLIKSRPPIIELWPNQVEIVNNTNSFINNDEIKRAVINFPTSGGKSLVAELAIVKELERDIDKKCIYIVPTNALVYEVSKRLRERFRRLNYNVVNAPSGYEPINTDEYSNDNVIVTTPEKLDMLIRNDRENNFLSQVSLIIFDEFHKIQDKDRGWIIEGSIWYLSNHRIYKNIKIILLSAIMDNGDQIINWVDNNNKHSDLFCNDWRPTIKLKGTVDFDYRKNDRGSWVNLSKDNERFREGYRNYIADARINYVFKNENNENQIAKEVKLFSFPRYHNEDDNKVSKNDINIKCEEFIMGVAQKLKDFGGSLIFFNTKDDCENFIDEYQPFLVEEIELSDEIKKLIEYIKKRLGESHLLIKGLEKGIMYHHGSLPIDIREALEDYFSNGYIKIMVCTTTLAEGVNFPIQNFIYTGKKHNNQLTVSLGDFKNIAGRAGRAYQSTFGQILLINFYKNLFDDSFLDYENHKNIVQSSIVNNEELFKIIDEMEQSNIENEEEHFNQISGNNFIKSLLMFFNTVSEENERLLPYLKNTLFAKQMEKDKLDKVFDLSLKTYDFFRKKTEIIRRKVQQSGLSFTTFSKLVLLANDLYVILQNNNFKITGLREIINEKVFLELISLKESQCYTVRKSTSASGKINIDHYGIFIDWVESDLNIPQLSDKYFKEVKEKYRMTRVTEYIRDMYEFKLPWIIGTLVSILIEKISKNMTLYTEAVIQYLSNLPLYIKFGINNITQLNLTKIGFNSRDTIKDISKFIHENYEYNDLDELRDYLKEIDPLSLKDTKIRITDYEIRKLTGITNNLKDMTNDISEHGAVTAYIAATRYYLCEIENRIDIIKEIKHNTGNIYLKHEKRNFYDENAVEVYYKEFKLGYIPRTVNEEISYYLDLFYPYKVEVLSVNVVNINRYIEIKLKISF
ncbi:MAG: DEAD/DEAH box helicase [Bacillota bacterium]